MRHRHVMAVDCIGGVRHCGPRCQVSNDLVAVEIEVDPMVGTAPFRASDHPAPERAGGSEVVNRESEMEWTQGHA